MDALGNRELYRIVRPCNYRGHSSYQTQLLLRVVAVYV